MKSLLAALIVLSASTTVFATVPKDCFGTGEAKGSHFKVEVSSGQIIVSASEGDRVEGYDGVYKYSGDVNGRDGKTYSEYPTQMCDEGCTSILVEDSLGEPGTKGLIKFRWRGESFSEDRFFCRDSK